MLALIESHDACSRAILKLLSNSGNCDVLAALALVLACRASGFRYPDRLEARAVVWTLAGAECASAW
jgi:hypothetical protein